MASTNQSPAYQKAEGKFLTAQTKEQKLKFLKEMIRECPKHKSAEKMLANLKTRLKKLQNQFEKQKTSGKPSKTGIKKHEMQAVIIGFTNTGKSTLLNTLTNAEPRIAPHHFTTKNPIIGMLKHNQTNIQLIEIPAFESEFYDKGLVNTADTILILITNLEQIKHIEKELSLSKGKKIIIFNNIKNNDERKISSTLKSKKYNFAIINTKQKNPEEFRKLKDKIFNSFDKIRVFTKEPGKKPDKSRPLVLEKDSRVKDAAEKILHGFSNKIKESFVTGPSSKFPNQKVGLKHVLKDKDILEFKTQ